MPVVGIFLLHNFAACVHCPPCPLNFKHIENMLCDVLGGSHQVAVNIKSECCCWTSQHSMKEEFWPRLHISASASRPLSAGAWRWWRSEGLARKTSTFFSSLCFHSEMMYCRLQSKVPVIKMTLLRSVLYFKQLQTKNWKGHTEYHHQSMQNSPPDLREELHLPGPGHGAGVGRVAVDVPGEAGGRDGGRGEARGRHGVPHRVPGPEVLFRAGNGSPRRAFSWWHC